MSFEELVSNIFDDCYNYDKLTKQDIEICKNLCQFYENKLYENELNSKLLYYGDLEESKINYENKKNIKLINYESYSNKDETNAIKDTIQKVDIYFRDYICKILFEISSEFINNGKCKLTKIKFYIDDNLILKKENQNLKKGFINLTHIKKILNKIKEYDIETTEKNFLILLLKIMNIEHYFIDIIKNINEDKAFYHDKSDMESDSDISLSNDENENED